jgi:hypothetical protein
MEHPIAQAVAPTGREQPGRANVIYAGGRSWEELRQIASAQRKLILGICACVLGYLIGMPVLSTVVGMFCGLAGMSMDDFRVLNLLLSAVANLALSGVQVWLVTTTAQALKLSHAWLYGLGSAFCCVGIIALLVVNLKATAVLREAGIQVGFLGSTLSPEPPSRSA